MIFFFTLTKHLLCCVSIPFAVWGLTAKLTQIYFLFFTFTTDISNLSIHFFLSLFISNWELRSFHLKVVLNGFSLAYLNEQHHSIYGLGPFCVKLEWLGHKPCDISTVIVVTEWQTKGTCRSKEWFTFWAGGSRMVWDCNHSLQNYLQIKMHKLYISGVFHLIFLVKNWGLTETTEGSTLSGDCS